MGTAGEATSACRAGYEMEHSTEADREFARAFVATNFPTFLAYALGTALIAVLSPVAAALYAVYDVASTVGMWRFVCVNCPYYGAVCPCGYSRAAAVLFRKGDERLLSQRYALIWLLMAPSWTVPILVGSSAILVQFSWMLLALTVAFAIVAFVVAPVMTRITGCCGYWRGCPSSRGAESAAHGRQEEAP